MTTFTLTLTMDDGLNLRMACGDAMDEWYNRAKRPGANVDACHRIAGNYSSLWDRIYDAMERAEEKPSAVILRVNTPEELAQAKANARDAVVESK